MKVRRVREILSLSEVNRRGKRRQRIQILNGHGSLESDR
jgi:hypothetical protein